MSSDYDYDSADKACYFIDWFLTTFGRINVMQSKVKYGEVRVYCNMGYNTLHSLVNPGYYYTRFPKWLSNLDDNVISTVLNSFGFRHIIYWYQSSIYKLGYWIACKRWSGVKKYITSGADYPELLKFLEEPTEMEKYNKDFVKWLK